MGKLCYLFCCPPVPSRIAGKLAFGPPPPSYQFQQVEGSDKMEIVFDDTADWMYGDRERQKLECVYAKTSRGNKIGCMFVRVTNYSKFVIVYSHGNAVDLGQMSSFYYGIACHMKCNVFSYDYSGYGVSSGRPSEKNIYADMMAAWEVLLKTFSVREEQVILYGQSIGTVPTIYLASQTKPKAVVLHSPFTSGLRLLIPSTKKTNCCDVFPNIDRVPSITSPVLVIHGTHDEIIDLSHAVQIYQSCIKPLEPLFVEGAGHNDVDLYQEYLDRMKKLISIELPAM
uniref:Abhydrolase domain-containing protein FAM108C1 n=2 Tax=Lygus hesperus TaxID=30085 RepID=A0A0A9Z9R2_LYGHE